MQNRSIFPYRRHGSKKRVKHGPNRKSRGPQKGLPNSARDLLPLLQPATKALAQMLAGRTAASGQLNHARTMLAQAERMITERAHNRLTPAEREEFFEQLARLKLTLADAEAEAEVQAVEEQAPRAPAPPVAQERLKEMALALSMPERRNQLDAESEPVTATDFVAEPAEAPVEEEPEEAASTVPDGRLVLPKAVADEAAQAVAARTPRRRRHHSLSQLAAAAVEAERESAVEPPAQAPDAGNGAAAETESEQTTKSTPRRSRKLKHQGLPEGWVIDEEGFVVPGAS